MRLTYIVQKKICNKKKVFFLYLNLIKTHLDTPIWKWTFPKISQTYVQCQRILWSKQIDFIDFFWFYITIFRFFSEKFRNLYLLSEILFGPYTSQWCCSSFPRLSWHWKCKSSRLITWYMHHLLYAGLLFKCRTRLSSCVSLLATALTN